LANIAKRLQVVNEKSYLKMGVTLDGRLLDQGLAELRPLTTAAASGVTAASSSPQALTTAGPPAPPERKVVRIIGEDGVRELPYHSGSGSNNK
jgi:hypothetical protein